MSTERSTLRIEVAGGTVERVILEPAPRADMPWEALVRDEDRQDGGGPEWTPVEVRIPEGGLCWPVRIRVRTWRGFARGAELFEGADGRTDARVRDDEEGGDEPLELEVLTSGREGAALREGLAAALVALRDLDMGYPARELATERLGEGVDLLLRQGGPHGTELEAGDLECGLLARFVAGAPAGAGSGEGA